jgi:Bacterial transglutaminase-like cysteine proteinase BTLCP
LTGGTHILDGETIVVGGIHVRLKGVAAPEAAHFGDPGEADEPTLPPLLQTLRAELLRFPYCPDEAGADGEDWWGFWWSLPDRGCGDCEDFAAYSYARLEQLGVARSAMRLMAAGVGQLRQRNGELAELLHVWLEVDLADETWTVEPPDPSRNLAERTHARQCGCRGSRGPQLRSELAVRHRAALSPARDLSPAREAHRAPRPCPAECVISSGALTEKAKAPTST